MLNYIKLIFKIKESQQNKNITNYESSVKKIDINEFRTNFSALWHEFKYFQTSNPAKQFLQIFPQMFQQIAETFENQGFSKPPIKWEGLLNP